MISFRHHVVSLLAVLLALAVGIVLGGGPLTAVGSDLVESDEPAQEDPTTQARAEFADSFAVAAAPAAYGDRLAGVGVSLVTLPGADDATAEQLTEQVRASGATVAGRWRIEDTLMSPGEKTLVETLGSQLATQQAEDDVPADASTYDRLGQLIGLSLASTERKGQAVDNASATIAESLRAGELLSADEEPKARAPYVIVLLGPDTEVEADPIVSGVLEGLSEQATGVVVAATGDDGVSGRLSRLRDEPVADAVATVDGADSTAGAVTAVLALTRWPDTRGGSFGAGGDDGAVPLG